MNELELRLTALGRELGAPATPELVEAVVMRLQPRRQRRRRSRRVLVAALGLVALLAGTAFAVPPLRHEIERVLDLGGVRVERVQRLPAVRARTGRLALGAPIPVSRARSAASFRALLPAPPPNAAYLSDDVPGGRLSLVAQGLLVMEFRGQTSPFMEKLIGMATRARRVRVNGSPGVYLDGPAHELFVVDAHGLARNDSVRLVGSVLLWQQGPLVVRIEGATSLSAALALARALR